MFFSIIIGLAFYCCSQWCEAGDGVTFKAGTLGYGGEMTVAVVPGLNLRTGMNVFNYERDTRLDTADVNGTLDLQTVPILIDWHPWRSGFRLSGGPVINNNKVDLSAPATFAFELGGRRFDIRSLDGLVTFNELSYYWGIGYGNAARGAGGGHIRFAFDCGIMYHGQPDVDASAVAEVPEVFQDALDRALREEVDEYEDDLSSFQMWPVISFGFSVVF